MMSLLSFNSEFSRSSSNIDQSIHRPPVPMRKKRIRSLLVNLNQLKIIVLLFTKCFSPVNLENFNALLACFFPSVLILMHGQA